MLISSAHFKVLELKVGLKIILWSIFEIQDYSFDSNPGAVSSSDIQVSEYTSLRYTSLRIQDSTKGRASFINFFHKDIQKFVSFFRKLSLRRITINKSLRGTIRTTFTDQSVSYTHLTLPTNREV